jgi:hypothetical protein
MLKHIFQVSIVALIISSCAMNVHSVDRAVMLEKKETETVVYSGVNIVGGIATEYNLGLGLGGRIGITDNFTFGASADINYNSREKQWVDHIFYGQVSIEQKFALVQDIFAIKFKEGIFLNNYFGTIKKSEATGQYEFVRREVVIPYLSPSIYISPEGRKENKKWQLTIGFNSIFGLRSGLEPWTVGTSLLFDYSGNKSKYLTGFELGGGVQRLVLDGEVIYLSVGLFFSSFKKK